MDNNRKLMKDVCAGVSVIICCYNSSLKIKATLEHLAIQKKRSDFPFEIILVNNNCTDDTIEISIQIWEKLEHPFPLIIREENRPGLNYARLKGIETARYEYLIFCDDDNSLCNDYLQNVITIFEEKHEVAMIGGVGEAVFGNNEPTWFKQTKGFGYAIGKENRKTGYANSVYGAGMAIRKSIFLYLQNDSIKFILTDRVKNTLSSGGDTELCTLVNCSSKKIWFDECLTFLHHLDTQRINWNYYLRLRASFGKANAFLCLYSPDYSNQNIVKACKEFAKFITRYFHLILFAKWNTSSKYAEAVQRYYFLQTNLFQYTKLKEKLPIALANKKLMQLLK
jgi:glycosyltransferase involved in cell wall biosynthesis